jgi:Polyketide cyclase / dehydrase and lipid transport
METISVAIDIAAPPMDVWAVLTHLSRYSAWNPLSRQAAGQIAIGNWLTLKTFTAKGRPMTVRPKVLIAEPGLELRWTARLPAVMGGEHALC